MTESVIKNVRIALKRISFKKYESIKDTLTPKYGEVIIIDMSDSEIRIKIGDGKLVLSKLPFVDENIFKFASGTIVQGYYFENKFYLDKEHNISVVGYDYKIYIDIPTREIYAWFEDEERFDEVNSIQAPDASNTVKGVSKLYSSLGKNDDGSINQKIITNEINKKFIVSVLNNDELIFKNGL